MLIQDLTIIDIATGEVLRDLTLDPTRDDQPSGQEPYQRTHAVRDHQLPMSQDHMSAPEGT